MKTNQLFWGIVLITFGILLLLGQFDIVNFGFWNLLSFWPIILILTGINLLGINDKAKIITSIATCAAVVVITLAVDTRPSFVKFIDQTITQGFSYNNVMDDDYDDDEQYLSEDVDEETLSTHQELINFSKTNSGELKIVCVAGHYDIKGDSNFSTDTTQNNCYLYSYSYPRVFSQSVIVRCYDTQGNISISPYGDWRYNSKGSSVANKNRCNLILNSAIPWDLEVENAAASLTADFTAIKLKKLELDSGASSSNLKLGSLSNCKVEINAGASNIKIDVPKEVGCRIESSSGLSAVKINGFESNKNGKYITENFGTAEKQISISIESGVSNIEIKRY